MSTHWLLLFVGLGYIAQAIYFGSTVLFPFVDADQLVMADLATTYASGSVPEPFFWGQNYLFPLESWLAVPFVAVGLRADLTLTTISLVMFYVPFLVVAAQCLRAHRTFAFLSVSAIPFLLPSDYLIAVMIPRNFGTTTSLVVCGIIAILWSKKSTGTMLWALFTGICIGANPTTILAVPALALKKVREIIVPVAVPMLLGISLVTGLGTFYVLNPQFVNFFPKPITPSTTQLRESLHSDLVLSYPLVLLGVIGCALVSAVVISSKSDRIRILIALTFLGLLCVGFLSIERIAAFAYSPFFSAFRFWTGVPAFAICLVSAALANSTAKPAPARVSTDIAACLTLLIALSSNLVSTHRQIDYFIGLPTPTGVSVRSFVENSCEKLAHGIDTAHEYVEMNHYNGWLMYGCKSINGLTVSFAPHDRRTWLVDSLARNGLSPVSK